MNFDIIGGICLYLAAALTIRSFIITQFRLGGYLGAQIIVLAFWPLTLFFWLIFEFADWLEA